MEPVLPALAFTQVWWLKGHKPDRLEERGMPLEMGTYVGASPSPQTKWEGLEGDHSEGLRGPHDGGRYEGSHLPENLKASHSELPGSWGESEKMVLGEWLSSDSRQECIPRLEGRKEKESALWGTDDREGRTGKTRWPAGSHGITMP